MGGEAPETPATAAYDDASAPSFCSICTLYLVDEAYRRAPWFRMVREPLRFAMIAMARLYRVDPPPGGRASSCAGCPRYLKVGLKRRSALFLRLNGWVNPIYDRLLERLVPAAEHEIARQRARVTRRREDVPSS